MIITYLLLRLIRHFLPEQLVRWMVHRNIVLKAGLETRDPSRAIQRYITALCARGISITDSHILIFGYGGNLAVAIGLLEAGCGHVTVCDHIAPTDISQTVTISQQFPKYFYHSNNRVLPNPEWITTYHGDIRNLYKGVNLGPFDIILSNSVFEHLDDVRGISQALSRLLKPTGCILGFVDLRDHFFNYPFEMLCYPDKTWQRYLNPSSNLNRWRSWQYEQTLSQHFNSLQIEILSTNIPAYMLVKKRIQTKYISGIDEKDAATLISIFGQQPITD